MYVCKIILEASACVLFSQHYFSIVSHVCFVFYLPSFYVEMSPFFWRFLLVFMQIFSFALFQAPLHIIDVVLCVIVFVFFTCFVFITKTCPIFFQL